MSEWVAKEPCPACGSRDNLGRHSDGHAYCFSPGCGYREAGEEGDSPATFSRSTRLMMKGSPQAIRDRGISKETCKKFGVTVEMTNDKVSTHYYPYFNTKTGERTAAKARYVSDKSFSWSGDRTDIGLFGQNVCRGSGKFITITEGEMDALAVSEMFDRKWDVVSIRDGSGSALRDIKDQLEWLEGYDSIVLCFDNDKAGKEAVDQIKDLFSPTKCRIVKLGMKDPNAMLMAGEVQTFVKNWWDAKQYQPDGLVMVGDTWESLLAYRDTPSVPYPWQGLNDILMGQRTKEVVVWAAETGVGKSQTMREVQDSLIRTTEDRVGCLMLEESIAKTTLGWMSFAAGRPLHKELNRIPDEELRKYWEQATKGDRFVLLDHNGWNNDFDVLKSRVRYMAKSLDCRWVVLDHLHYALSSVQGASGDWAGIDELMTQIVGLALECDIGIHLVCHTSDPRSLRGSKGIEKLADAVIYLERDKHHVDPEVANTTAVVVDKNRFGGDVGTACWLKYDKLTGRMTETSEPNVETDDEF